MDRNSGINSNKDVVRLAREVLSIVEHPSSQTSGVQEELLKIIRKLQIAAEGPAHYVIRKRHQVARTAFGIHQK